MSTDKDPGVQTYLSSKLCEEVREGKLSIRAEELEAQAQQLMDMIPFSKIKNDNEEKNHFLYLKRNKIKAI